MYHRLWGVYVCVCTHVLSICSLRGLGVVIHPSIQILASEYLSPLRGTRVLGEIADSRDRAGKVWASLKYLVPVSNEVLKE